MRVPFGQQQRVGVVLGVTDRSEFPKEKLKPISKVIDSQPLLPALLHKLLLQSARYYHHPIGEVYETALPALLRQGRTATAQTESIYRITPEGEDYDPQSMKHAPVQQRLLKSLQAERAGLNGKALQQVADHWRTPIQGLMEKGLVTQQEKQSQPASGSSSDDAHPLNAEQQQATTLIQQQLEQTHPSPVLLEGVTGSGKTEVYLQLIQQVLDTGKQALILVPEISLTPQTVARFQQRFAVPIALLHSGRSATERLNDWISARDGTARILIGTRSAIFAPLKDPGILIVDEEHDGSFKQQDGFRYSARDLAVLRGQLEQIPVVLGSATPSFESLHNAEHGKYHKVVLSKRAGGAVPPQISLIDVRSRKMAHLLSAPLIEKIEQHLSAQGQVLLFLNRRGYAPALLCRSCGWIPTCPRCEIHYTYHQHRDRLVCHHCGGERPHPSRCPECEGEEIKALGAGTERIEEALQQQFPHHSIARIDRDTTRKKGEIGRKLEQIHAGEHQLLLGTQMLAKGHHFPNVTLVTILDADGGLFGADFRTTEQMGQLITQVAGRAGRAERPGEMAIQTHHPDHPLLLTLLQQGYPTFSEQLLSERRQALLPPYSHWALIRAEAAQSAQGHAFLQQVHDLAMHYAIPEVEVLGPIPAPMEKRAGRYRLQLLLQSSRRTPLHQLLASVVPALETMKEGRKVRWSVDVDPIDML